MGTYWRRLYGDLFDRNHIAFLGELMIAYGIFSVAANRIESGGN